MRTIKIISNIDFQHLFDNHTEPYALVYTEKLSVSMISLIRGVIGNMLKK